jgi:hypothetical protein
VRKLFGFLSLLALIVSIFFFFYIGFGILKTKHSGFVPLEGLAYIIPFGLVIISAAFVVLTLILHLLTKKKTDWSFKKFLLYWFILLLISLASFGISLLIIAQPNTAPPSRF